MGTHIYTDLAARETRTVTSIDGTVAIPTTTHVILRDGREEVDLIFTDLDTLDEMARLFEQARAEHVVAVLDGKSEMVTVDQLGQDDLAVLDGDLVCVDTVVLSGDEVIVRYGRKYAGAYDMTAGRHITMLRSTRVRRLVAGATLAVVR